MVAKVDGRTWARVVANGIQNLKNNRTAACEDWDSPGRHDPMVLCAQKENVCTDTENACPGGDLSGVGFGPAKESNQSSFQNDEEKYPGHAINPNPNPVDGEEFNNFCYFLASVELKFRSQPDPRGGETWFHCFSRPTISIIEYLRRIAANIRCSEAVFTCSLVYVDRMLKNSKDVPFNLLTMHRIVLTAILVATKYIDDVHFSNKAFAKVGGVSMRELNSSEIDFLFRMK
jgi:hypothetical protein